MRINFLAPRRNNLAPLARNCIAALKRRGHDVRAFDFRSGFPCLWNEREPLWSDAPTIALRCDCPPVEVLRGITGPKILWYTETLNERNLAELARIAPHFDALWYYLADAEDPHVKRALGAMGFDSVPALGTCYANPLEWPQGPIHDRYDVAFVGGLTNRRRGILDDLRRRGLRVLQADSLVTPAGTFDSAQAGRLMRMAPVCLNLHAYDVLNIEPRLAEANAAGAHVVSEKVPCRQPARWGQWVEPTSWPTDMDEFEAIVRREIGHVRSGAPREPNRFLTFDDWASECCALLECAVERHSHCVS